MPWDPAQYLKFAGHRLRPAIDLLGRIDAEKPAEVVDLGAGAGNVTRLLKSRWPDAHVIGVSPELQVEVRTDILKEQDGPMLLHGLQGFHGARVAHLPTATKLQPRRDFLAERYEMFKKAG